MLGPEVLVELESVLPQMAVLPVKLRLVFRNVEPDGANVRDGVGRTDLVVLRRAVTDGELEN